MDLEHFVQVQLLLGLRIICVWRSCFLDLEYFMSADILIDADILIGADILIDADILGRQHFDVKYYYVYCRRTPTF